MSTPQERLRIFRQEQQSGKPRTAEERRRVFFQEQAAKYQQPEEPQGILSSFQTDVAGPLLRNVVETAADVYNAPGETLQRVGRGALEFISAFDPAGNAYDPTGENAQRLAELGRRADERLPEPIKSMKAGLAIEEAKPRTRAGAVAGAVGRIAGEVAFPTAPETLAGNIITAPFAGAAVGSATKAVKAGVNAVRRTFGKGAAQIIEAEAAPALTAEVAPSGGQASPAVQRAMQQFEQEVARIKELPPAQQAAEMQAAIQRVSSEASGVRPVSPQSRAGYPPLMEFPENPNAIQQAGILPGEPAGPGASIRGPANVAPMEAAPPPMEAEFGAPQFGVKAAPDSPYSESVGPSVSAPMDLNATVAQAAESIPRPVVERIKNEFLGTLGSFKSIKSSIDISAVMRQGGILFLRPFQAKQSGRALGQMFKAFKEKNYTAIHKAIAAHPDLPVMEEAGLYLGGPSGAIAKGEEAFIKRSGSWVGEKVGKTPGIKQSDQMYVTMLDSQRVQRFQQFKQAIDKLGLAPEEAMKGYKAAAQWVNIATGRGSLGQTIDKSFEALNYAIFSPRFVASRLNILNPVMYARNAATPAGRVVLKGQMADLVQYLGVVGATMYAAKQAGADVTLNPHDRDFGKIKLGTWRYDLGAGLTQALKMMYLVGEDMVRAGRGEKPTGKDAIDIAETFLSYKLSPPAQVFRNFIKGRTIDKKPYTVGQAAVDLAAPMQWADFVDAYQKEAWGGVLKASPGITGVGVGNYEQTPVEAAIERAQPLFTELKRLGKQVTDLRKKTKQEFKNGKWQGVENEDDASFNARVQQFGQNYTLYGLQLLDSPRFRQAPDSVRVLALDQLNERAKKLTTAEFPFPELALDADTLMDSAEATATKRTK
jgi:hypothetical protein